MALLEHLSYFLREIPKRRLGFLLQRGWDEILRRLRHVLALFGGNPYADRLAEQAPRAEPRILDLAAVDRVIDLAQRHGNEEIAALLDQADRHGRYEFEIFGSTYQLDRQILWDQDFPTDYRWPRRFHTRYRYADLIDLQHATDIKVPWELGRLQYLPVLSLAHRVTGDKRHAAVARELFDCWRRENPVGYGIQWVVGMDVALRAISLVLSADLLTGTPGFERFVDQQFARTLAEHGRFLFRNIEYSDINGNHHTSCLVGLLYLGVWLDDHREAGAWRARAVEGLKREILLQTYPDGVCHEGSIPYHRLVTELFLHAFFVCRRVGIDLEGDYRTRLEGMLEFIAAYTKPTGEAPVWGDADDGRVHKLGSQPVNDHRYLLTIGEGLFGRTPLPVPAAMLSLDTALLLDTAALDHVLRRPGVSELEADSTSRGFDEGGFFILRAPGSYCMIDCGDIGLRGRGGHGHYDALSVEMVLLGEDVLTDTGCAAYTRSMPRRGLSLSARSHNAAVLDDCEPAPLSLNRWPHATHYPTEVVHWSPGQGAFVGRHRGYTAVEDFDAYQRAVHLCKGGGFTITDELQGSGVHNIKWYFHLAEGVSEPRVDKARARLTALTGSAALTIQCGSLEVDLSLVESPFYPTYGLKRQRQCLVGTIRTTLPFKVSFEFSATQVVETCPQKRAPSTARSSPAPPSS